MTSVTKWRKCLISLILWALVWWGLSPWIVDSFNNVHLNTFKIAPSDSSSNEEIQIYSCKRHNISRYLLSISGCVWGGDMEHGSTCQTGAAGVGHLHWSLISNTEFSFEKQLWNCASVIVCCLIPCVPVADNDRIFYWPWKWILFQHLCLCLCVCAHECVCMCVR